MSGAPEPASEATPVMQRVRIGLTGLACVFLLVLLAASVFGLASEGSSPPVPDNAVANGETPKEPLAELGVAPGNAPEAGPGTVRPSKPAAGR